MTGSGLFKIYGANIVYNGGKVDVINQTTPIKIYYAPKPSRTIVTNFPGNNNDIVWTAKDPNVRIKYLAPAGITTTVSVEEKNVIVTPGIKTNMLVRGSLMPKSPTNPARLLMYAGKDLGGHIWTHNGKMMSFSGLKSGEAAMSYNGHNWTYACHS